MPMTNKNLKTPRTFDELHRLAAAGNRAPRVRLAVVCGRDRATLDAVAEAVRCGWITPTFVGAVEEVKEALPSDVLPQARFFAAADDAADDAAAARLAVQLVRSGQCDVLMKGLVSTDVLLRAVLSKTEGILQPGGILTHVAVCELPQPVGRLVAFTDAAVIPYPTPQQRRAQVAACVKVLRALGEEAPRIALLHCSEHVSEKFPHTVDYAAIATEAAAGAWGEGVAVDGPLDLRCALDAEALRTKGIPSPLAGRADALIFPDIEAGNVFYKTATYLLGCRAAGVLCGTTAPVVLPSRGDSGRTKMDSIALAALVARVGET